jgi:hypothetical protein
MTQKHFLYIHRERILLLSVIVAFLSSFIPFCYNALIMWVTLTSAEVMIAWSFCALSIGAASVAFYAVLARKSLMYPWLYLGFHGLFSLVLAVLEPIWLPLPICCILGMIAAKKCISEARKFMPQIKSKRTAVCLGICFISLAVPLLVIFDMPTQEYILEPKYQDAPKEIEISFTLANLTRAETGPNGLLTILDQIHAMPYINVSVVAGFLEEFVLNTTLLIGREFIEQGEFIKSKAYYNDSWELYETDVKKFESFWNNFTRDVRAAVDSLTIEELMTNDRLYATSGLYYDQLFAFASHNIAVDLMPLVEREVYINDYTIDRINKTITIMKRWLSINNIPHRGIVVDTERMWGKDDETLMDFYKKGFHDDAVKKLGYMIKDLKVFEWQDKGLDKIYGPYTKENWTEYAVKSRKTMVASATFGLHVHDLFDGDDAQQNLFKISILPENVKDNPDMAEFDYVGIMTYETGDNSEHAVYGYCKAGDYFFGERNVPYIYSGMDRMEEFVNQPEVYLENLYRKFKIMQNYGYETIGIWALTNIHCFSEWEKGWCGGLYDFTRVFGGAQQMVDMFQRLNDNWNDTIYFNCTGSNFALTTVAVSLLDVYLPGKIRYTSWPIEKEFNQRVRPELFGIERQFELVDLIIRLLLITAFMFFALYINILSKKAKNIPNKYGFYSNLSLFFLFTGINYLASELELQFSIYPRVIPKTGITMWLTSPVNSDIFMILFIILSAIPMLYGLEKYILNKEKFILTQMAIIGLVAIGVIIFWHDYIPLLNAVVLYGWLILALLLLRTLIVYATITIKATGPIRNLGILMGAGFILLLVGTIFTGTLPTDWIIPNFVIGHFIVMLSVGLMFRGILKMQ